MRSPGRDFPGTEELLQVEQPAHKLVKDIELERERGKTEHAKYRHLSIMPAEYPKGFWNCIYPVSATCPESLEVPRLP